MGTQPKVLRIPKPDDWHIHLRDDALLKTVLPYTSQTFARAIVMPNLTPPITTIEAVRSYKQRILAAIPASHNFTPLMTCYLTDTIDSSTLINGFSQGDFFAAKLYPAHATTNSSYGIKQITHIYPLFEHMQRIGMPLLIHGEVTDPTVDIYDREARFIEQHLEPLRQHFPELKIVLEHITTKDAAQYLQEGDRFLGATITPQHLMFNRNHMLVGGIRPHLFCLPILKRHSHQEALQKAVLSCNRLFLGTDSAPHLRSLKESACGCAGIFNAPNALAIYAAIFEKLGALEDGRFEAFCSHNGANFYNLPINSDFIELEQIDILQPQEINIGSDTIVPFLAGEHITWRIKAS